MSGAIVGGEEPRFVERVEATSRSDAIEIAVTTSAGAVPEYSIFGLREPDRLVIDIPGFGWQPGLTAHIASDCQYVTAIRASEFSAGPPITRIVLDLAVPAQDLRPEVSAAGEKDSLRFGFAYAPGEGIAPGTVVGTPLQPVYSVARQADRPVSAAPRASARRAAVEPASPPAPIAEAGASGVSPGTAAVAQRGPRPEPRTQQVRVAGARVRVIVAGCILLAAVLGAVWSLRRAKASERPIAAEPAPAVAGRGEADVGGERAAALEQAPLAVAAEDEGAILSPEEPKSPPSDEVAALLRSLNDQSVDVRKAAAAELVECVRRGDSRALVPHLSSPDPRVRATVAGALGEGGAAGCVAALAPLTEDPDPSVRASVLYAFSWLGAAAADYAGAVRERFRDDEDAVRAVAIEALAGIFPYSDQVAGEVLSLASSPEPLVRQAAAAASFEFALRGVTRPLIELLGDLSRRAQALELLQQAGDAVLWKLSAAARQAPADVGEPAAEALSYAMSRRWTAEDFTAALDSPDPEVRLAGIEGLRMVGGDEAVREANRIAKTDPSPRVRARAEEILRTWTQSAAEEEAASRRA